MQRFPFKSVARMERTVSELEAGNYDADDSEVKHRYDNQRQLNIQLQEQKRWLEHELEQVLIYLLDSFIIGKWSRLLINWSESTDLSLFL